MYESYEIWLIFIGYYCLQQSAVSSFAENSVFFLCEHSCEQPYVAVSDQSLHKSRRLFCEFGLLLCARSMPRNPYLRQRVMSTRSDEKFGKKAWDGASLLHQCWASSILLRWEVAMNHRTNRTQNRFLVNITLFTVATSFWDIFALQPTWHNHVQAKSSHAWLLCVLRESLRDAAPAAGSDIQQDGDCRQAPRQSEKAWWNQPLHAVHCLRISQVFSFSSIF